jgi:hypothetical protein
MTITSTLLVCRRGGFRKSALQLVLGLEGSRGWFVWSTGVCAAGPREAGTEAPVSRCAKMVPPQSACKPMAHSGFKRL